MQSITEFCQSWDRAIEQVVLADYLERISAPKEGELTELKQ